MDTRVYSERPEDRGQNAPGLSFQPAGFLLDCGQSGPQTPAEGETVCPDSLVPVEKETAVARVSQKAPETPESPVVSLFSPAVTQRLEEGDALAEAILEDHRPYFERYVALYRWRYGEEPDTESVESLHD